MNDGSVAAIGRSLLTTYSLAFELISVVLLLAILGALVIARGGRGRPPPVEPVIVDVAAPAAGGGSPAQSPNPTGKPTAARAVAEALHS